MKKICTKRIEPWKIVNENQEREWCKGGGEALSVTEYIAYTIIIRWRTKSSASQSEIFHFFHLIFHGRPNRQKGIKWHWLHIIYKSDAHRINVTTPAEKYEDEDEVEEKKTAAQLICIHGFWMICRIFNLICCSTYLVARHFDYESMRECVMVVCDAEKL